MSSKERKTELQAVVFLKERANGSKTKWNKDLETAKKWMRKNKVPIRRKKEVETSTRITFIVEDAKAKLPNGSLRFKGFTEIESSDDINFILGFI